MILNYNCLFLSEAVLFLVIYLKGLVLCDNIQPNFVFFLTDDQDLLLDGMIPMKNTIKLVANEGVTFKNAFVNSPICCPSRSTILTGKYIHNTGVRNNSISGNCSSMNWQTNHEPYSFISILKNAKSYNTFYAGKYLNQYGSDESGGISHIPKGYDWWIGLKGNSKYYNYTLSINGTGRHYTNDYLTDVMKEHALTFLNQNHIKNDPFFMMLAPPASHAPFTPAPRHENMYPDVKVFRSPSFNYSSENKHWIVNMPPKYLPENVTILDNIQKGRLQTLLAVDEMVEAVVSKLKTKEVLNNTYIIFTSDNGFHIGQFGQPWDKRQPYETDIRVPFLMSGPKIMKNKLLLTPISTVDIAPTILDFAAIKIPNNLDGKSFKRHILNVGYSNKHIETSNILIEYYGEGNIKTIDESCPFVSSDLAVCTTTNWCKCEDSHNNTYHCLRQISDSVNFKFCLFYDDENFIEVYDLKNDPYELHNLYGQMNQQNISYYYNILYNLLEY